MATLVELTAQIVSAHASGGSITSDELLKELNNVYNMLKDLDAGVSAPAVEPLSSDAPKLTVKQAFKKDEVICMVCGKGGFKTLKRHLLVAHEMKPGPYRKAYNIPSTQPLVAKNYSEQRKNDALDRGQGDILAKAREARAAKKAAVSPVKAKASLPAVKVKAPVPAIKAKAAVPAKLDVVKAPVKPKAPLSAKSSVKAKK